MQQKYKFGKYELDNHQIQLINIDGNVLVIAGAGSGKTFTILAKINYLIEQQKCLPEEILVISFTNASVNDITSRLTHNIKVFTFHKLAIEILHKHNFKYTLCSSFDLRFLIHEYLKTCGVEEQKNILKF